MTGEQVAEIMEMARDNGAALATLQGKVGELVRIREENERLREEVRHLRTALRMGAALTLSALGAESDDIDLVLESVRKHATD